MTSGELRPFAGILTVVQRPTDYTERRDDGYQVRNLPNICIATISALLLQCLALQGPQGCTHSADASARWVQSSDGLFMFAQEPEYVFIVGTVHFSERSAEDAATVIQVCKVPITCRH